MFPEQIIDKIDECIADLDNETAHANEAEYNLLIAALKNLRAASSLLERIEPVTTDYSDAFRTFVS